MNVTKFLKVLCLAIVCTLGTHDLFGMQKIADTFRKFLSGTKKSTLRDTGKAFENMSLHETKEAKSPGAEWAITIHGQDDSKENDVVRLERDEEEEKILKQWKEEAQREMSRTVDQKNESKEAKRVRTIFGKLKRRNFLIKPKRHDRLDKQALDEHIKGLSDKNRLDLVMGIVLKDCMSPNFVMSDWMGYLTPEQIQTVVTELGKKAEKFMSDALTDEKELKTRFDILPENFFKMVVRKTYHEIYKKLLDDVKIGYIFRNFGQGLANWSFCGITSLAMYSDLLAVSNSICPIINFYLNDNKIVHIEGLNRLTSLIFIDLQNNSIAFIANLDSLAHLEVLNLQKNHIEDLMGLDSLVRLKTLFLRNNNIDKSKYNFETVEELEKRGVEVVIEDGWREKAVEVLWM